MPPPRTAPSMLAEHSQGSVTNSPRGVLVVRWGRGGRGAPPSADQPVANVCLLQTWIAREQPRPHTMAQVSCNSSQQVARMGLNSMHVSVLFEHALRLLMCVRPWRHFWSGNLDPSKSFQVPRTLFATHTPTT